MHTCPALIPQDPVQSGIHVELNPLGARILLGASAAELSGHVVDLADHRILTGQVRLAPS